MFEAENSDIFDVLAHISFNADIRYRQERRDMAQSQLTQYRDLSARQFVDFLLDLYVRNGIRDFRSSQLAAKVALYNHGTTSDLAKVFGGNAGLREAYYRVQESLYSK